MHTNQALRAYGCAECTFLTCQGFERYCGGFPEKRKPKRFWKTDPQWKAPKWCPRRKTPAVYRVYHYIPCRRNYPILLTSSQKKLC